MRNYYYLTTKYENITRVYKLKTLKQFKMYIEGKKIEGDCEYLKRIYDIEFKKPLKYDILIDLSNLTGDCYENKQV